jgi:hypothetical protein
MRRYRVMALVISGVAACGGKHSTTNVPVVEPLATDAQKHVTVEPHTDDEDSDIEVVSSHGHMEPAAIEKAMAPHTNDMAACYTELVGTRKWLGGSVQLHWWVDSNGKQTAVALGDGDLGAWPIEKCILDIARSIVFPKPKGGKADFSVPLQFSAKGRATVWDADRSLAAIGGQTKKLDDCRKVAGEIKPTKYVAKSRHDVIAMTDEHHDTTVAITVYVGPGGKAASVGFATTSGTAPSDPWFDCAEKIAMAWRLPDPRGQYAKLAISVDPSSSKIK